MSCGDCGIVNPDSTSNRNGETTMNNPDSKYRVYSVDILKDGNRIHGEVDDSTLEDILMWLSDDVDDDTKSKLPTMEPGETCIFIEGEHGNFESREIHFIKLRD